MGATTGISWTEATWNITRACTKRSPGCAHCYAEALSHRFGWTTLPWTPANEIVNVITLPERLDIPIHWPEPKSIFVDSTSDLFHDVVADDFIAQAFAVMAFTPRHTYQTLTKRSERMAALLSTDLFWATVERHLSARLASRKGKAAGRAFDPNIIETMTRHHLLANVHVGVTVENGRWTTRTADLAATPAARRFVSSEPLLGAIDSIDLSWVDQIIVGGESGNGARRMDPSWVDGARIAAEVASVGFFFKQFGNMLAAEYGLSGKGTDPDLWPAAWRQRERPLRLTNTEAIARESLRIAGTPLADRMRNFRAIGQIVNDFAA